MKREDKSRILFTVYGVLRKDESLEALGQFYAQTKKHVQDCTRIIINRMDKADRKKKFSKYQTKKVQKVKMEVACEEVLAEASILEIPKDHRINHFSDEIIELYKQEVPLYKLQKLFGVSREKIRAHLVRQNIPIRGRGYHKQKQHSSVS